MHTLKMFLVSLIFNCLLTYWFTFTVWQYFKEWIEKYEQIDKEFGNNQDEHVLSDQSATHTVSRRSSKKRSPRSKRSTTSIRTMQELQPQTYPNPDISNQI